MATRDDLETLRKEIDEIDRKVVKLLNERAAVVLKVRDVKTELGLPRHDPAREAEVKKNIVKDNPGPLPNDAIERIYDHLLYHMRLFPRVTWDVNANGGKKKVNGEEEKKS